MSQGHVARFSSNLPAARFVVLLLPLLANCTARAQDLPSMFEENCAKCHGSEGHGNGPMWTNFVPDPANLTLVRLTDDMAYSVATKGVPGTAMAAHPMSRTDFDGVWQDIKKLPMNTNLQWGHPWLKEAGERSSNLGQSLYVTACAGCHGPDGRGDGAWARTNDYVWPKPTNFHARSSDVGRLYYVVMKGRRGTMMAPQGYWLDEVGGWAVAQYVHGLYRSSSTDTIPEPTGAIPTMSNPFSLPARQAVQNGRDTLDLYCVPCHNAGGMGSFLAPNIVDRDWLYGNGTDTEVRVIIDNGIPGRLMPSFKSLTEERRWEAITYLRSRGGWPDPILTASH